MIRAKCTIIVFMLTLPATTGCTWTSPQEQLGWKAEDYYDDPKVIELCRAIESSDLGSMEVAVESGADIRAIGQAGMTPLMWSFPNRRIDCFQWLLEQGADPNVCLSKTIDRKYLFGRSVTYMAIAARETDHYPLVLQHGGDPNLFCEGQREPLLFVPMCTFMPAPNDPVSRIEALLDAGADINARGSTGATLAMSMVAGAHFEIALLLLQRGADEKSYQEKFNRQLVHFVIPKESRLPRYSDTNRKAYFKIVDLLKKRGVNFDMARADLARWKSWGGKPIQEQARLRKLEHDQRKARESELQPQPELADPGQFE